MDDNKRNLLYFESSSMRGLYECMDAWQEENQKRLMSVSIERDGSLFCCIGLSNPTEVYITSPRGGVADTITIDGRNPSTHLRIYH